MLAEHGKLVASARAEAQRQSELTLEAQQELEKQKGELATLQAECGEWYHVLSQVESITEATRQRGGTSQRLEEKRRLLGQRGALWDTGGAPRLYPNVSWGTPGLPRGYPRVTRVYIES